MRLDVVAGVTRVTRVDILTLLDADSRGISAVTTSVHTSYYIGRVRPSDDFLAHHRQLKVGA